MSRRIQAKRRRHGEQGYMLLAVVLTLSLMVIAAAAAAPEIAMSIRREREAELIHRGTQYMRAIQHYYKKFGRYPMRIEDLENTNNMRFLRRHYKDPITGKDFRLLHFGEVNMAAITGPSAGAGIMGAATAAAMSGAFGQPPAGAGSPSQTPALGNPGSMMAGPQTGMTSGLAGMGTSGGDTLAGKVFGGGPIIGVVSTSHKASIREFNKKNHYNDWYFIYDPTLDRGGLIEGPAQPALAGSRGSVVGAPGAAGNGPGGTNTNPSFGNPSMPGFVNPTLQGPGAMIPAQPQSQPQ